jgi:alkaline phosphatase D
MKYYFTLLLLTSMSIFAQHHTVHMANGIKVGEVNQTSAIIWTRLTQNAERHLQGTVWKTSGLPAGSSLHDMQDTVAGTKGQVQVTWSLDGKVTGTSDWLSVDPDKDFTKQLKLTNLVPGKRYGLKVTSRSLDKKVGQIVEGGFNTAPAINQTKPVQFTVVTGQEFSRRDDAANGHKIYKEMLNLKPNFFVHTGDIVYYDYKRAKPSARNITLARFKWNRMFSLLFSRSFHNNVSSYFIKDDHDTLRNDAWPGQSYGDLTWKQGLAIYREQVPMDKKTYRTIRWGKDLQIWLVEGRDFRSANNMPDGPEKTIWGKEQKEWFKRTVKESNATFRILISPTPVVGPDRGNKNDNHANKGFTHEGDEIRSFISTQKNMFIICGDRHWQYVSVDPKTGVKEFSCGPTSDKHAGGFSEKYKSPMHRYLKVQGGFLGVEVKRVNDKPIAIFRHYAVDGSVYNEETIKNEK